MIPSTIAPYVLRAIGPRQARRLFQTGERIDAAQAQRIGLVHETAEPEQLDARVQSIIDDLLAGGPVAQSAAKSLIEAVTDRPITRELIEETAVRIADIRSDPEAIEGLSAFLEKRPPDWVPAKMNPVLFDTILIANRGEIACRIMSTCRRLGIRAVAVYSDADAQSRHVRLADEAVRIGPPPARESYLAIDRILDAARKTGAQAIHPGYGFLAENADFAEACAQAGLVFIGPPAAAIRAMGSKAAAKALMRKAGVPLTPGYEGENQEAEFLRAAGRRDRLSRDDQGQRGRRRQGNAPRGREQRVSVRARIVQARGGGCVRRRLGAAREVCCGAAARRGAGVRRQLRHHRQPVRARLFRAAAASEGDRRGAGARDHGGAAGGAGKGCAGCCARGWLRGRGHGRVPVRSRERISTSWR